MSKLIMMKGLPASGKTTRAKEIMKKSGNYVRLNRDLLREMLHFSKWTGRNEGLTKRAQRTLARHYLNTGINVIIDDTNLFSSHKDSWSNLAKECNSKFEVVECVEPLTTLLLRDLTREKKVGHTVIKNMALQAGKFQPEKGYILCDLDGTLADIRHRLSHVKKDPKDWKSFFEGISDDPVRQEVLDMINGYSNEGYDIIIMTARPDDYKEQTMKWLEQNAIPFFTVIMRRAGDRREDSEVKQQMLDMHFHDKSLIHKVIDDRPRVLRMWKENGLDVVDVGEGIEF